MRLLSYWERDLIFWQLFTTLQFFNYGISRIWLINISDVCGCFEADLVGVILWLAKELAELCTGAEVISWSLKQKPIQVNIM